MEAPQNSPLQLSLDKVVQEGLTQSYPFVPTPACSALLAGTLGTRGRTRMEMGFEVLT